MMPNVIGTQNVALTWCQLTKISSNASDTSISTFKRLGTLRTSDLEKVFGLRDICPECQELTHFYLVGRQYRLGWRNRSSSG
jgi:hypothetical protein